MRTADAFTQSNQVFTVRRPSWQGDPTLFRCYTMQARTIDVHNIDAWTTPVAGIGIEGNPVAIGCPNRRPRSGLRSNRVRIATIHSDDPKLIVLNADGLFAVR